MKTNKIKLNGHKHNHGVIEGRRKTGELKQQRLLRGLNPTYYKTKAQTKKENK